MNPIKGWLADAGKNPDTRHVDTCDGVRALAICIVAWYHIWQQSWLYPNLTVFGREISFDPLVRSGYIWVDMMILISGFCLYLPWARLSEGEKGQSPAAFYEKRLARVHPSYLLPIAVMLGSIFTLSRLASTRQFTVLRVSGIGPWRFCGMLLMPGIVLVICAYLLGNLVAPPAQRLAKEFKLDISGSAFTGKELDSGIWVRDVQRNEAGEPKKISFVNVQRLRPGEAAYDWVIYVFDRPDHLTSIVTAKSGTYSEQDGWVLHDVVEETVPTLPKESRAQTQARVERKVMKSMVWGKSLDGNIFGLLMIKPEDMSLQEIHYYIEYLKENGQTYKRFDTAFWSKAFYPLAILVMLLLSMPFAYQNARAGGMAIKIFCGIMIGIFYYALNNLFAFMSALDSVPSIISAILPSVMMTLAAIIAMWYVERRS